MGLYLDDSFHFMWIMDGCGFIVQGKAQNSRVNNNKYV